MNDQLTRSAFMDDRKRTFLNANGDRPLISPIADDVLNRARGYRLQRLREQIAAHDVAGLLLYDSVNIRYAFDSSNMQVWTAHNPVRYALILADGPAILWEFKHCEHLNDGLPGIDEIRNSVAWCFMAAGDKVAQNAKIWSGEIADLVQQYGGAINGSRRTGLISRGSRRYRPMASPVSKVRP